MALKRRDPAEPPNPALIVTMAVMLIAAAAFSSGLYREVTLLRLVLLISLLGAAVYGFQRALRKRQ